MRFVIGTFCSEFSAILFIIVILLQKLLFSAGFFFTILCEPINKTPFESKIEFFLPETLILRIIETGGFKSSIFSSYIDFRLEPSNISFDFF